MDNRRRCDEIFRGGDFLMDEYHLIIESIVLNEIERQITEQVKKQLGNNVNITFNNKPTNKDKKKISNKFDRIKYMKECEKNWRK